MKLPIIVYGAPGAGASMLIWIIKRLRDTTYAVNNPLDNLGTAHNQPLLPHWFGSNKEFDTFSNCPEKEQVVHAALTLFTKDKIEDHCSFSIYFEDDVDVNDTAILCHYKIPRFSNQNFEEIVNHLVNDNELSHLTHGSCCNIPLKTMLYRPVEDLLELVSQHLKVNPQQNIDNYNLICNVIHKWRNGNQEILKKHSSLLDDKA